MVTKEKEKPKMTQPAGNEVTDFYDIEVKRGLPTGSKNKGLFYHLVISNTDVGQWDDGRSRLDINTVVASGEYADKFGPRGTLSLGGYEGVRYTNGHPEGLPFKITASEQAETLVEFVKLIHPEPIAFDHTVGRTAAGDYIGLDDSALETIAEAIVGAEFIAKVREDKNGYMRWSHVHSMADPPKGFEVDTDASEFTL